MFPTFPVVLTETMFRQLDAFCEQGIFDKHKKAFHEKTELFVLHVTGETLVTWLRSLKPLKDHVELVKLRVEIEEAVEFYYAMCDERD